GWLRSIGRLRIHSDATGDELRQLAIALAPQSPCPKCGAGGLVAVSTDDDEAGWPEARRCESCGKAIEAERIEVLANATLCAACQRAEERGDNAATGEFCEKCGSPLLVTLST